MLPAAMKILRLLLMVALLVGAGGGGASAATGAREATHAADGREMSRLAALALRELGSDYAARQDAARRMLYVSALDDKALAKAAGDVAALAATLKKEVGLVGAPYVVSAWIPEPDDYARLAAKPDAPGSYDSALRRIVAANAGPALLHEYVHAVHIADAERLNETPPLWLAEGLATLYEASQANRGQLVPQHDARMLIVRQARSDGSLVSLDKLLAMDEKAFMANAGPHYAQSRYLLYWVRETGRLKQFYTNYRRTCGADATGRAAMEATFGRKLSEVERLWHRWLDALEVPEELKPRQLRLNLELEQLTSGVRIRRLDGDREAIERQKLQKGDIVKRFDGRRVDKAEDLIKWLGEVVDRSSVEIVVLRDGRRISLTQPLQAGR
jgi:hypothetical protein